MTSTLHVKAKLKRHNPNPNPDPFDDDIGEEDLDSMHGEVEEVLSKYGEVESVDVKVYKWER